MVGAWLSNPAGGANAGRSCVILSSQVGQVNFDSGAWSASGTETVNAVTYNVYANSLDTLDKLLVQQGMSTSILTA